MVLAAPLGGKGAPHRPVLLEETLTFLAPERGGLFVDCTVGLGGHSEAILKSSSDTRVLGMDLDTAALEYTRERLAPFGERFRAFQANFRATASVLEQANEREPSGVLVDLGVSSLQFDSPERGFSFRFDAPLDMRMDPTTGDTAADLYAPWRRPRLSVVYTNTTIDLHRIGLVTAEQPEEAVLRVINPADHALLTEPAVWRSFRNVDVPLADPLIVWQDVVSGPGTDAHDAADALLAALPRELGWPT